MGTYMRLSPWCCATTDQSTWSSKKESPSNETISPDSGTTPPLSSMRSGSIPPNLEL
eukprot:CAMPEP_0197432464 /NCGR_PEP_ID=MMETSP1175-20131217/506_1 /TAXON_ID=1003142 /ORGANISM="Triceratium dubium, Strain CCMP147" /LENGTH=56 /DNA_ID=CAMNT_0042960523 /DNA_START=79 /DNA_END=249 /DNA_ORIENTATION=-